MNINKHFNNYIKSNFCGLSAHTLAQVLADFMRTGWDTTYFVQDDFYDDFDRWGYLRRYKNNNIVTLQFEKCPMRTLGTITGNKQYSLKITDKSFTHLAAFLVEEDLYDHMVHHNNADLFDAITDIVHTCPYL